jgi:hypothetical protein
MVKEMNKRMILYLIGILGLILSACTPGASGGESVSGDDTAVVLNDEYGDALGIQGQLALGTVQLDETDLAVDEAQAAELLPLWQALQSLGNSDTAATAESDAVVNQIQDTMTAEQIQAIAAMALTTDSLTALQESGELGSLGNRGDDNGNAATGGGGFLGGGGFPGGGVPGGGGPPGGGFPGGGIPGGGAPAGLSEDDIATRQAAFASGDFQEQALTGMVIRLLAQKTGEDLGFPGGNNPITTVLTVISEATGLSVEDIQTQTAGGITLGELVVANGGDVETVHDALVQALGEMPNAAEQDLGQLATEWLAWPNINQQPGE